jgi:uncharacterized caspase-like protein
MKNTTQTAKTTPKWYRYVAILIGILALIRLWSTCQNNKTAQTHPPTTYAVVAAVADYKVGSQNDLHETVHDAEKFYSFLTSSKGMGIPTNQIRYLTNADATRENILAQMKYIFSFAQPKDRVIFFFSGHGAVGEFIPYDVDPTNENTIMETGLSHNDVKEMFRQCKAQNKICMADACHSASIDQTRKFQTASSKDDTMDDNSLEVLVLMSSRANETSLETRELGQGLFSYYLIRGLQGEADANQNRAVTAREIFDYLSTNVPVYARKKGGSQHPVAYGRFDDEMPVTKLP